jgi:hypothetical protein
VVVADGQARRRALLGRLKQVVDAVAVDLKVLERDLDVRGAGRVLLDLLAAAVDGAQQARDDAAVGQRLAAAHRVRLAGAGAAVGKDGQVEAIEEVLDRGRDWLHVSFGRGSRCVATYSRHRTAAAASPPARRRS